MKSHKVDAGAVGQSGHLPPAREVPNAVPASTSRFAHLPTLAEMDQTRRDLSKGQAPVLDRIDKKHARERSASTFRAAVWKRDKGLCRLCGRKVSRSLDSTVRGHVHHIRGRNVAPEDKFNPDAALLLCAICHAKLHAGEVTAK